MNGKTKQIECEHAAMADQNVIGWLNSSPQDLNVHLLPTCSELP